MTVFPLLPYDFRTPLLSAVAISFPLAVFEALTRLFSDAFLRFPLTGQFPSVPAVRIPFFKSRCGASLTLVGPTPFPFVGLVISFSFSFAGEDGFTLSLPCCYFFNQFGTFFFGSPHSEFFFSNIFPPNGASPF